jgi:hypothetical protein
MFGDQPMVIVGSDFGWPTADQNWRKFEAHKWGRFIARLKKALADEQIVAVCVYEALAKRRPKSCSRSPWNQACATAAEA